MAHLALRAQTVGAVDPDILGNDLAFLGEGEVFLKLEMAHLAEFAEGTRASGTYVGGI
jgi:hypothetical protein